MKTLKFKKLISVLLIVCLIASVFSSSLNSSARYENQADGNTKLTYMFALFYTEKPKIGASFKLIFDFWILDSIFMFSSIFKSDITILRDDGAYYYIDFNGEKGYVSKALITGKFDGRTIILDKTHLSIYTNDSKKLTVSSSNMTNLNNIKWTSSNTNIVTCSGNGRNCTLNAKQVGSATVTAELDGKKAICYIYIIDRWNYGWETTTKKKTTLREAPKSSSPTIANIPKGSTVLALADMHNNNKYCYIKYKIGDTYKWGYVPFTALSSQGEDLNQYANFDWEYPLNTKYINISSYYGQRDLKTVPDHKGVDITGDIPAEIAWQPVRAVCDATVTELDNNNGSGAGNYVALVAKDCQDPSTGKDLRIIYMHLKSNIPVIKTQEVKAGDIIGYVSNSNGKSDTNDDIYNYTEMGVHLHLEITRHGEVWGSRSFANSVNPLWFYPNIKFKTDQISSWYGMYWSNDTTATKININ